MSHSNTHNVGDRIQHDDGSIDEVTEVGPYGDLRLRQVRPPHRVHVVHNGPNRKQRRAKLAQIRAAERKVLRRRR